MDRTAIPSSAGDVAGKIERYRRILTEIVRDYSAKPPSHGRIAAEAIIDPTKDHYEVQLVGWDGVRRVHGSVIHLDIIDGRIWIQWDGTDRPVAHELEAAGVPREDIILAFHPAHVWPHTGYGVVPELIGSSTTKTEGA